LNDTNVTFYSSLVKRIQDSAILVAQTLINQNLEINDLEYHDAISADPRLKFKENYNVFKGLTTSINVSSQKKYIKLYKFTYTFFFSSFISLNLEKDYSFYTNGHFY
jgi:hypothetical protein